MNTILPDPTYDKKKIEANIEWHLAFVLSEILNAAAPLGWSKYISDAKCLLQTFKIEKK